jgi:hypothetical protein
MFDPLRVEGFDWDEGNSRGRIHAGKFAIRVA